MVYGYARVSTRCQAKDGNSLEAQEQQLKENGAMEIYSDSFTGTKIERPNFDRLLNKLQSNDTLIVTKLDRIARSMTQGSELVNELINKGVKVHILNIGIMDITPSSKLIRNIFFSFAEFERDMIVERTQEGKAIAKSKEGFTEGRPKKFTQTQLDYAMSLLDEYSFSKVAEKTNISIATLKRESKKKRENELGK
ncbi:recombinase family protein [Candidatus Clostridium stratigraminis]|uniref:Recombinase family protein n=1 Tax=Candidatus Clostridium stratigraminis TaxID=3381661 RepID=A0ABW8T7B8_9CLOT